MVAQSCLVELWRGGQAVPTLSTRGQQDLRFPGQQEIINPTGVHRRPGKELGFSQNPQMGCQSQAN